MVGRESGTPAATMYASFGVSSARAMPCGPRKRVNSGTPARPHASTNGFEFVCLLGASVRLMQRRECAPQQLDQDRPIIS
jgi:hypothetical protein